MFGKPGFILLTLISVLWLPANSLAGPIELLISVTQTRYDVSESDTAQSLLDAHYAGAPLCSFQVESLINHGRSQTCGSGNRDYSLLAEATFSVDEQTTFDFQVGADWGRGGGVIFEHLNLGTTTLETLRTDDIWWAENWNHADVFNNQFDLEAGDYRLTWVGFENCCGGTAHFRFGVNGGDFQNLTTANIEPFTSLPFSEQISGGSGSASVPAPSAMLGLLILLLPLQRHLLKSGVSAIQSA